MAFGKFGKYHPDGVEVRRETLELVAALREDFEWVKAADASAHELRFRSDVERCDAFCDRMHLRYVAVNLLQNAVKYSPAGSSVELEIEARRAPPRFSVTDRGIGIPPEALSELYSPFYRASNVGARPGTGMGLAIVKKSAQLLGWRIEVDTTLHVGTRFDVLMDAVVARS